MLITGFVIKNTDYFEIKYCIDIHSQTVRQINNQLYSQSVSQTVRMSIVRQSVIQGASESVRYSFCESVI